MRKVDYWNVGGCEEDLVGHYGQTDPIFWYRAEEKLNVIYQKDMFLNYEPRGEANIKRDKKHNYELFEKKKLTNKWSTDFVRFDWEKIF